MLINAFKIKRLGTFFSFFITRHLIIDTKLIKQ